MKILFTSLFLLIVSTASAQWSNTTNLFYDSLHTPVSTALKTQQHPIVVKSYPDSGYFIIWEDYRNDPGAYNEKGNIYAQKYDKDGNRLWADNGVPVASGTNGKHYNFASNQDYRNRSYAATDSAGGFYVTYSDDSVTNYNWPRICVQHVLSNGNPVFPGPGFIVAQTPSSDPSFTLSKPQLTADGNKGFYISFSKDAGGNNYIYVFCYRDNNGAMQYYGGGIMDENAIQRTDPNVSPCGNYRTTVEYPGTSVSDYNIWYDLQGGCNLIMNISGNTGGQGEMLGYNKIWRAKKNSTSTQYYRNTQNNATPLVTTYQKDSVYRLYFIKTDNQTVTCGSGTNAYTVTSYRLTQNGYQLMDGNYQSYVGGGYSYNYPKGTTVSTTGNINVSLMAVLKRTYINNTLSNFSVQGYNLKEEKYDSIPYQRASSNNPEIGYNPIAPSMDKLNFFRNTVLAQGNYFYDFSLAGGGNQIYSSAIIPEPGLSNKSVRLQHLAAERITADSFAIEYKTTTKEGIMIGKDVGGGYYGNYDFPLLTVNNLGVALFSIREYNGPARISPIFNGAELAWGAMGRTVGTGTYIGGSYLYYAMEQSLVALDPVNGSGVISWKDNRAISGNTGENIFMRHLDSLNLQNYYPPYKRLRFVYNVYGPTTANPNPYVLLGSSKKYSLFEGFSNGGSDPGTSPVTEVLDNNYLGFVTVSMYDKIGAIRTYNSKPYLDRNFTIKSDSIPPGANINIRLFFTTAEFDALKTANPSIPDPGFLAVIRQPNTTSGAPSAYTPIAGEEVLVPIAWRAVAGGYYIEIVTTGLGNFFINGNYPGLWSGAISTDWNTTGNWSDNTIPVAASNVTIPTTATNMPLLAGNTTINNLTLQSGTTLTLNGKTFTATGVVSGSGTITGSSTSSLILSGSGSAINFTQTSSATRSLNNLTLNAGSNASLGGALDIFGTITLTSATLNLNANSVTLKSTATGTARVANLTGSTLSNASNITVERYIPANTSRAWRLLSVPTISAQSINATWQNGQPSGIAGPTSIGTMITGNNGNTSFDFQTPGTSMLIYNAIANIWAGIANTTSPIATDNGYMLFVRGDRTATPSNNLITATTLSTTGILKQGNYPATPISVQANKFGLIGNPYASQIDFRNVTKDAGIDNTFYVWDPKLTGSYGLGGYQTLTYNGTNYIITPGGGSYGASGSITNTIESGQAFFVHATSTGNISFTENTKSAGSNMVFRTVTDVPESLITNLYSVEAGSDNLADGTMILFNNFYSNAVDGMDAFKLTNFGINMGMIKNGKTLSVEKRMPLSAGDTIFFNLTNTKQQQYRFEFTANGLAQPFLAAWLIDKYLNTSTPINLNGLTSVSFTVNTNTGSSAANRFSIVFSKPVVANPKSSIVIYPNPVYNGNVALQFNNMPKGIYIVKLLNALGQIIINKQINYAGGSGAQNISVNKIKGTYLIEVTKPDNSKQTNKVVIN